MQNVVPFGNILALAAGFAAPMAVRLICLADTANHRDQVARAHCVTQ
jgi:hypothetical protein